MNVQSVKNKLNEVNSLLFDKDYVVVCFSGYFLNASELNEFPLNGFAVSSFFVRNKNSHGGSGILSRENIIYNP